MSKTNGKVAEAIALIARQSTYAPGERRLVVAAALELEARGEPYTRAEGKLLDRADRLRLREPEPAPEPPLPAHDKAVAARAAALAAAELVLEPIMDKWLVAAAAVRQAELHGTSPAKLARLTETLRAAEAPYKVQRSVVESAKAALSDAQQARQRAKAAAGLSG